MDGSETGVIADVMGVPGGRHIHEHTWPAVDVPLTSAPHRDAAKPPSRSVRWPVAFSFSVSRPSPEPAVFQLSLETAAGHNQPSGAAQDRRMWVEITAYDQDGQVAAETGTIADDAPEQAPPGKSLPMIFLHDKIFDEHGEEVHMFWDAAPSKDHPDGFESSSLPRPPAVPGPHSFDKPVFLGVPIPGRVEVNVRMRPMGLDVLQDLVKSGDLDAGLIKEVPTFTVYSAVVEWKKGENDASQMKITTKTTPDCKRYRCLIDPKSDACQSD